MLHRLAVAFLALFLADLASVAKAFDVGPPVGSKFPAVTLPDSTGHMKDLLSFRGSNGLAVVFFRSAKWCPYCKAQLIGLHDIEADLSRRGFGLAAISYDAPEVQEAFKRERGLGFNLLSDADSKVIDALGLRDPQYPPGNLAYGVPRPVIFLLAPDGVIRAKLAEDGYKVRPSNEAILSAIDHLAGKS